jgi:hypothetical protein
MRTCPLCGSARIYPSRLRSLAERARRVFSEKQPYRCHACNHRGWYLVYVPLTEGPDASPDDLRTGLSSKPITSEELEGLDKE